MNLIRNEAATDRFDAYALRADFPIFDNSPSLHYLDNAAMSHIPRAVLHEMQEFQSVCRSNVKRGAHRLAALATARYERARDRVAVFLNAYDRREIVWGSGVTAAINLVAHSYGSLLEEGDEIAISVMEHHSNIVPWQMLAQRRGVVIRVIDITDDGRLCLDSLQRAITDRCRLVAIAHASNVTGAITDIAAVVAAARSVGAKVLVDGAQYAPLGTVDVQALGIDFYALSGHKMFGPTGIGVLWGRGELLDAMPPLFGGGEMITRVTMQHSEYTEPPYRFEAGTPPLVGAIGLEVAIDWLVAHQTVAMTEHKTALTERLLNGLSNIAGVRVLGPEGLQNRLGVVSFVCDFAHPHDVCQILDDGDVALRGGALCAQPLLERLGVDAASRASLAPYNVVKDIDAMLEGLEQAREIFSSAGGG